MTRIDQFESVFKSADKPLFRYEPFSIGSLMVLTDLDDEAAESFAAFEKTGPWLKHIPQQAGSVVIFTEALAHGTLPWTADHERRALFSAIPRAIWRL